MIEMRDVRNELLEIVSGLYRVENQMSSLADHLAPEVRYMWDEEDRPTTVAAHLHATLQAVLGDYVAEALERLMKAGRQNEETLGWEYCVGSGSRVARGSNPPSPWVDDSVTWSGGVSFRKPQQHPGEGAGRKEPPPCSD